MVPTKLLGQRECCPISIYIFYHPFSVKLSHSETLQIAFEQERKENKKIFRWFEAFFRGKNLPFPLPLPTSSLPPFTKAVLEELKQIPFGQTRSYSDIATRLGNKNAARAVGNSCRVNPFPLIVPCHRVTQKNALGGFAYGPFMKQALLDFEIGLLG